MQQAVHQHMYVKHIVILRAPFLGCEPYVRR